MKRILFVCTGNTCRSPMAEYLLKAKAKDRFEVRSAGLAAWPGQEASEHVQTLLAQRGIEIDHKAQQVSKELIQWADLVLSMTQAHANALKEQFPEEKDKIFTLKRYVRPDEEGADIADPFGGDLAVYEETLAEIEKWLEELLKKEEGN